MDMSRSHAECADSDSCDWWVAPEVLLRQEPDEGEDEEEDENGSHPNDEEEDGEGYSE